MIGGAANSGARPHYASCAGPDGWLRVHVPHPTYQRLNLYFAGAELAAEVRNDQLVATVYRLLDPERFVLVMLRVQPTRELAVEIVGPDFLHQLRSRLATAMSRPGPESHNLPGPATAAIEAAALWAANNPR